MKTSIPLVAALALLPATFVHAQSNKTHDDLKTMPESTDMTHGEIKKIDTGAKLVTIKHGPLKNLGMPGMTMSFGVKDPALLKQIKVGDRVNFTADMVNGAITVTKLELAK